ncbi:MAG: LamG domain-containing protein [Planctomycetes bacterium]|nr:LamG domain-containing protein [Planctomycetota bacterium]
MYRKLLYLAFSIMVSSLVLTNIVNADLIGWWRLDEGSGTTATDMSGAGHDGQFAEGTPEWVEGKFGNALKFDGTNKVEIPDHPDFHMTDAVSIALWAKPEDSQPEYGKFFCKQKSGEYPYGIQYNQSGSSIRGTVNASARSDTSSTPSFVGEWAHLCMTYDGTAVILYKDGEEVGRNDASGELQQNDLSLSIGGRLGSGQNFNGVIDDVKLYNHALTPEEVLAAMESEGFPYASGPNPSDGSFTEDLWVNVSWSPGDFAVSHDVYIGDSFDDVESGAEGTFFGNQTATFFVVGFPGFPFPDGLTPGATYFWRIDEVNDTEPNSPWKGSVWSFNIPPKTAYLPVPANNAESIGVNTSLTWTPGFGAKLHTIYFGDNFEDVNDATVGLSQGTTGYSPSPLEMAKTYYWRIDEFDGIGTYKGNVWSYTTEGAVGSPEPAKGAVDVIQAPVLTWVPGVFADTHEVYFGTDADAVKKADTSSPEFKGSGNLGSESYDPGQLEWNTTYYWRIDEANNANANSPWTGPLWSFTTANFLIVDDMESYNDLDPADPNSNRIFFAWIDGFDTPTTNGSVVGYANPPFAEQSIVHGGSQSMPMSYNNGVGISEATLTLDSNRDWTVNGINTLTIWFRGDSGNAAENLYVALNGNAVVNHENPNAAMRGSWLQWDIDLQAFADQGVNLANVNSITLGLGNKNNPVAGGSGMMYFDDISLYALEP